ncbi:DUF3558 domain-containing protein [Actinophytocola sp.]|uniref:DUF3558 domain-containing protein n=1 Tax=Actinophytocola sp. TaxID=1872138 RepID=UPI002ED286FB
MSSGSASSLFSWATRPALTESRRVRSRRRSETPVGSRLILAALAVVLVTAGCTSSASGQPTPVPDDSATSNSEPQTSASSGPTVEVPPRPRDISLEGLDPCTLFTDEQRAQLLADDVKSGESESKAFAGMKECVLSKEAGEPFYEYNALAVTTEGVEEWLTGNRNVDSELISVQGFPAAKFKFRNVEDEGCDIAVGVADRQYLWVQMFPASRGFKQDQLCQMAEEATNMAMTTLQTLK